MTAEQSCPKCSSTYVYMDGAMWICPECAHEWNPYEQEAAAAAELESTLVRDANGVILNDGDSVVVIKDLKIKGSSSSIKGGTKVKGIRLHDAGDGHNISGKIDGFGSMNLKSEFVKKS